MEALRDVPSLFSRFADMCPDPDRGLCNAQELFTAEFEPNLVMVGLRAGEWSYIHAGTQHRHYTGLRPFGLVRGYAPPPVWVRVERLYEKCLQDGQPLYAEDTGCLGRAVDILTSYCRIPIRPANGFDAILASVWDWQTEMPPGPEEMLADFILRVCGPVHRSLFLHPGPGRHRVAAQLALLREISEGACGCEVGAEDLLFLQLFLMGLRVEHPVDSTMTLLKG